MSPDLKPEEWKKKDWLWSLKKEKNFSAYKQGNMDIENPIFKTVMLFKNKTQPVKCLYP